MTHSSGWRFIANNIISLATVFAGVGAIILMTIGVVSPNVTAGVTLALLTLLATSQLVENRIRLSRIEEAIALIPEQVSGASVTLLPNVESVMDYLIDRTEGAEVQIDQASIDSRRSRNHVSRKKYDSARMRVIKRDKIRY